MVLQSKGREGGWCIPCSRSPLTINKSSVVSLVKTELAVAYCDGVVIVSICKLYAHYNTHHGRYFR